MSTINQYTNGSVSVSRNATIGGAATIRGNATVGHNLRVDGLLEARALKACSKGLFLSVEDLVAAYPNPDNGWWAFVGTTFPADVYIANDGTWSPTGAKGGEDLEVDISWWQDALDAEEQARAEADNTLSQSISAEAQARQQADNTLSGRVDSEAQARQQADSALGGRIDSEAQAREDADTLLGERIDALEKAPASVVRFDGIISSCVIETSGVNVSSGQPGTRVLWCESQGQFVLTTGLKYYISWVDADSYNPPRQGAIYLDASAGVTYAYDGAQMLTIGRDFTEQIEAEAQARADADTALQESIEALQQTVNEDITTAINDLEGRLVVAIEVDEQTGAISLLYDDESSMTDAYIDSETGEVTLEYTL